MATEHRTHGFADTLAKLSPESLQALNELFWEGVREHVAEIRNDDMRHQAEDHLDMLLDLLGSEEASYLDARDEARDGESYG